MTDHERAIVHAFNDRFEQEGSWAEDIEGIAHRKKQHRFSSQLCDVLVDSSHEDFYLGIECKSVKESSTNKVYFSQHFNGDKQVEKFQDFISRSGRTGFLGVEIKRGRGRKRESYLVAWDVFWQAFQDGEAGVSLSDVRSEGIMLDNTGDGYRIPVKFLSKLD